MSQGDPGLAFLVEEACVQVATGICTIMPIWESRGGLWTVTKNMLMCRPAVDEVALTELKADLEKPHMARVPGAEHHISAFVGGICQRGYFYMQVATIKV